VSLWVGGWGGWVIYHCSESLRACTQMAFAKKLLELVPLEPSTHRVATIPACSEADDTRQ
jgi:hypothetical protein